jgi:FAD-linked sulfhydryl oxidase
MSKKGYYKTSNEFMITSPSFPVSNIVYEPYIKEESTKSDPNKLEMKWETVKYANSADPKVWGPAFWFILHNAAVRYPKEASPLCAERMKGFIIGIPIMLPCEKCADHATAHIEANWKKLDEIVKYRSYLFNFFVDFHNLVNRRCGKPEMSYKDAYELYTKNVNVTKLTYGNSCDNDDKN